MRITKQMMKMSLNENYKTLDIWSINGLVNHCQKNGSHFFDKDSMRFFACRLIDEVYPTKEGLYFVTSEKKGFTDSTRVFTVRFYDMKGSVKTIGEFGEWYSKSYALTHALKLAYKDNSEKKAG